MKFEDIEKQLFENEKFIDPNREKFLEAGIYNPFNQYNLYLFIKHMQVHVLLMETAEGDKQI